MFHSRIFRFALFTGILFSEAFSSRMDKELYEAVYQFEIKGNFAEAQDMLSRISIEGDDEDRSKAFFLLGKIQELSESPLNATFYYRQALANPANARDAYFLASRIESLDTTPERLVIDKSNLAASIRETFGGKQPSILLSNNQLYRLHNEKFVSVPTFISESAKILAVTPGGIWFSDETPTLHFQPKDSRQPVHTYRFDSAISSVLPLSSIGTLVITEKTIAFAANEGIRFSVENRYRGCSPVGFYQPQNAFVVNCPDNALHLFDAESGAEKQTLSLIDPIQKTLLSDNGIFVSSSNTLWFFRPQTSSAYLWKSSGKPIEDAVFFEGKLAVLESDGKLKLLDPESGVELSRSSIDGEKLFQIARGTLGVFSKEGALSVVDTALRHLWHYHFGKPLAANPLQSQGLLFLPFEKGELLTLDALHYGGRPVLSQLYAEKAAKAKEAGDWKQMEALIDSAQKLEPGNPTASFLHAIDLERIGESETKRAVAWSDAVRYSFGDKQASSSILSHYAKIIGASYVHFLPLSPRTLYPNLFSTGHTLFTIDPAAQKLIAIEPSSGSVRWSKNLGLLETSPVLASDNAKLAIANGFQLQIHDLTPNGKLRYSELPGKPFQIKFHENAIYVSTWNGYFIKLLAPNYDIAWTRKLFALPFLFDISKESIAVSSLEGMLGFVSEATGQNSRPMIASRANTSVMDLSDSTIAIATDQNEIRIYTPESEEPKQVFPTSSAVLSLRWVPIGSAKYLLVGFADQRISLYGPKTSIPIWTFAGKNSIYATPVVNGNHLYIDQQSHIAQISLSKGTVERRFSTPGGAGTPFILDNTLFCTSPKRLLYAFPLTKPLQ